MVMSQMYTYTRRYHKKSDRKHIQVSSEQTGQVHEFIALFMKENNSPVCTHINPFVIPHNLPLPQMQLKQIFVEGSKQQCLMHTHEVMCHCDPARPPPSHYTHCPVAVATLP
eukprot:TRINITY_DN8639_c1_g1_i1.p1 TRINITY_DN8639_c1_g1~~TRINITY_DN8639_c1_g1_i1.p1  ORF type:complete len:112 (+),score=13.32 TRINITY_DN8639_c1_g1_i1:38-373(+)